MNSFMQQSQSSSMDCNTTPRIIIGLDYGTSGTGVSTYLVRGNKVTRGEDIEWPLGGNELKVPSRIAYPVDNPSFTMISPCWGFDIKPNMRAYTLTKLFLDSNADLAEFDDQILQQAVSLGNPHQALHPDKNKAPVDVVADYLSHVLKFVWKVIQKDSDPSLNHLHINLQFTIPATWSDWGRTLSGQAVIQAWDFKRPQDTLTVMSEPDAAAESVHAQLKEKAMLETGDGILVCDCGSGTVDITTYLVMDCTSFNLSRITAIQGAKCGGAAIDSRLFDLMEKRLPKYAFQHLNHLIAPGGDFMTKFKLLKRVFGSANTEGLVQLPLPIRMGRAACGMPYFNPDTDNFILAVEDVQSLFDPVIYNIIGLVNSQITAADREYGCPVINKIVLVGGLASSPYLQRSLRQCFEVPGRLSITLAPKEPIMAVSNGSALAPQREVEDRRSGQVRSPRHYEIGSHLRREAENIEWVIVKGDQYKQGHAYAYRHPWPYQLYQEGYAKVMTIPLYSCELSSPPHTARFNDVTLAGLIVADFPSLELGGLHHGEGPNKRMLYELEYFVVLIFDTEKRALHCTVQALGKVIGLLRPQLRF